MVDEGVRRAYLTRTNLCASSVLSDPAGTRVNTGDNTPAVVHVELVPGNTVEVHRGGQGRRLGEQVQVRDAQSLATPSSTGCSRPCRTMGAGWCPPGMLGIGIGGTAEKAMLLAKESLMDPIDMHELMARGPHNRIEELRIELYEKVNALGIGAQGLGGLTTVLDVKISDYPTHAASKPVAMIPNCAATRHAHFVLDGIGPGRSSTRRPSTCWPDVQLEARRGIRRRVNLDTLTRGGSAAAGNRERPCCSSGKMLTGRDAAHKRIAGPAGAGRAPAGRRGLHQPLDLLRRPGRPGARRGGRSRRAPPPPPAWTSSPT